ncbi:MAG: hypothetical protein K9M51_00550 [Candidatus Gracilibacteria bacterium]|nr:hypothetical protein [Candidatus Gracilibacteria bacterium]
MQPIFADKFKEIIKFFQTGNGEKYAIDFGSLYGNWDSENSEFLKKLQEADPLIQRKDISNAISLFQNFLKSQGFESEWTGDPESKIDIARLEIWKTKTEI